MFVIDLQHFLTEKGDIAAQKGPARRMADFVTAAVAHASDFDRPAEAPGPVCFKCPQRAKRRADTSLSDDAVIRWRCPACGTHGQISGWQETFWDLSQGTVCPAA